MKQYCWQIYADLKTDSQVEYINSCGEFCDVVLEKIKPDIAEEMNVPIEKLVIGQEDWGWYLEFQKDGVFYELNISSQEHGQENSLCFGVTLEAQKLEKKFIFNQKFPAENELQKFSEAIGEIARRHEINSYEE